jgi:hypothetical protein
VEVPRRVADEAIQHKEPKIILDVEKDLHYGSESGIFNIGGNVGASIADSPIHTGGVIPDTWPTEVKHVAKGWAKIEGAHTIQGDLMAVNPNRSKSLGYQVNCGYCVVAYELRRQGFDVEAMPQYGRFEKEDWEAMFDGFSSRTLTSENKTEVVDELTNEILLWGEGARGTVLGKYDDDRGHIFSFEISNGNIVFVDSQNIIYDVASPFKRMIPSSIRYGRLDNLTPSVRIINAVRDRRQ